MVDASHTDGVWEQEEEVVLVAVWERGVVGGL